MNKVIKVGILSTVAFCATACTKTATKPSLKPSKDSLIQNFSNIRAKDSIDTFYKTTPTDFVANSNLSEFKRVVRTTIKL